MRKLCAFFVVVSMIVLIACCGCQKKEGTFEKMGRKMDETVEKTKDSAKDAMNEVEKETRQAMDKAADN